MAIFGKILYGISLCLFILGWAIGFLFIEIREDPRSHLSQSWLKVFRFLFFGCSIASWVILFALLWVPEFYWLIITFSIIFLALSAFSICELYKLLHRKPESGKKRTKTTIWLGIFSIAFVSLIVLQFLSRVVL